MAVRLCAGLVEHGCGGEGCIDPCPEPDEQDREGSESQHESVPSIRVDQDVGVDDKYCWMRDVDSHLGRAIDVVTALGLESGHVEEKICGEKADYGLIQTIEHIQPDRC